MLCLGDWKSIVLTFRFVCSNLQLLFLNANIKINHPFDPTVCRLKAIFSYINWSKFSRFLSAPAIFIYLLIYLSVCLRLFTWFLVWDVRRLGSSISVVYVSWAAISFFICWFLTELKFFRVVLLVHEVSGSRFPFWRFR